MSDNDAEKLRAALGSIGYTPPARDRSVTSEADAFARKLRAVPPMAPPTGPYQGGPAVGSHAGLATLQPMAPPRPPPPPVVTLPPPRPPPPGTYEPAPGGGYQPIAPVAGPGTWGAAGPLPAPASPQERMDRMGEARPGELYANAQQGVQQPSRPLDAATLAKLDAVLNGEDTCECRKG